MSRQRENSQVRGGSVVYDSFRVKDVNRIRFVLVLLTLDKICIKIAQFFFVDDPARPATEEVIDTLALTCSKRTTQGFHLLW